MPARLHCPKTPQDAEGRPGPEGQRRGFAHWAPSGSAPRARKGQGLGAKGTARWGQPFHTARPQTAPRTSLCPVSAQQTALSTHLVPVCSPWPGRQSNTRPQARTEITWWPAQSPLWAKRKRKGQVSLCVHWRYPQRAGASCPDGTEQQERFPDHTPHNPPTSPKVIFPKHSPLGVRTAAPPQVPKKE